jgi:thiol-disulfide isomerase/thioredoxin
MTRSSRLAPALAIVGLCLAPAPAAAQTNEELLKKIEELSRRVEALEKKQAASAAKPAPDAAATERGKQEARALYGRIDDLLAAGKIDEANAMLAEFNAKYAGTDVAGWARTLTSEMEVVGRAAPQDWSIDEWYQGESEVDLKSGDTTLIIFWESWCPHCRSEVPKFQRIHEENKAKGLRVVGVTRLTRSATAEAVKSFIAESKVSYPMAKENGALASYFNVQGIPAAAVVKDGKIIWRGHPQRLNDKMLAAWL